MKQIIALAKKELLSFFSTPVALIFIGTYLLVSLFVFFWVEGFFSRNIADVRPLFDWLPLLMIFLVSALTMRMWSDERKSGTLEFLLTEPISVVKLVFGKFFACLALIAIALLLTLPLPVSISFIGLLDWGPIWGSYLAALMLAAAYISIGIFVSARTDNQIVSLMVTILICLLVYLIGADRFTGLLSFQLAETFRFLGTGSRFESITRGVIDFRDIYYYLSLTGIFLALNCLSLESLRWSKRGNQQKHYFMRLAAFLLAANLAAANVWLDKVGFLRADLTEGKVYSISPATKDVVSRLQEPLILRGYFSSKTHPLLSPLVPQLKDLLKEFQVAGGSKLIVEFVDPRENPELEQEANEKYGIRPIPFQVDGRYEVALVNSYFNLLVKYGDQVEVLGFDELIEVKMRDESDLSVKLKNPEYQITKSIKKALQGFNSLDGLFASIKEPIKFTGYFSDASIMPEAQTAMVSVYREILDELSEQYSGKFEYEFLAPEANGGAVAKEIAEKYKFRPIVSLVSSTPFYFNTVITQGSRFVVVPFPEAETAEGVRRAVTAAIKRFSTGFLKTVGYFATEDAPANPMLGNIQPPRRKFQVMREELRPDHQIRVVDLKSGAVPDEVDILLVLAPKGLDSKQVFAIDQFLMKGGTVVLSTSSFFTKNSNNTLVLEKADSGLSEWLKFNGVTLEEKLVLDPINEPYAVPVPRNIGGFMIEEIRMLPYPFFVDVRGEGLNSQDTFIAGITQVTINWPSPIKINAPGLKVTELLQSSEQSWLSDSQVIIPDFEKHGELGFPVGTERKPHTIGAVLEGSFKSFFADKDNPLIQSADQAEDAKNEQPKIATGGLIESSPESARLIVISSNEFLNDLTLQISASSGTQRFRNSLQLVQNAVDWSLEDRALLDIRSRSQFARTLNITQESDKKRLEFLNYGFAIFGLILVWLLSKGLQNMLRKKREEVI